MRIKELSQSVKTPVETIRYYERTGLMPQAVRSENNYRVYTRADQERLRFIRNCRALDMSLDEIRELIGFVDGSGQHQNEGDCSGIRTVLEEHLGHVRVRLKSLKLLEKQLSHLLDVCEQPQATFSCEMVRELFSNMENWDTGSGSRGVHTT